MRGSGGAGSRFTFRMGVGMSKHTPGPWFFDQHGHVYGTSEAQPIDGFPGGKTILHPHVCTPRCIANARLIAAAPELLGALETLVEHFEYYMGDNECRPLENARAAIAKASITTQS